MRAAAKESNGCVQLAEQFDKSGSFSAAAAQRARMHRASMCKLTDVRANEIFSVVKLNEILSVACQCKCGPSIATGRGSDTRQRGQVWCRLQAVRCPTNSMWHLSCRSTSTSGSRSRMLRATVALAFRQMRAAKHSRHLGPALGTKDA